MHKLICIKELLAKYFSGKFEPFRNKMAKMMNYIDLDTPSVNRCGTFEYFWAVTL